MNMEYKGIKVTDIDLGEKTVPGVSVEIPGTGKYVLQILCKNGMLYCGLFLPEKIDAIGFAACVFSAPQFSDMLANKPTFISAKALELGVTPDMTGREIAELFDR